jgi:hypothetical protein
MPTTISGVVVRRDHNKLAFQHEHEPHCARGIALRQFVMNIRIGTCAAGCRFADKAAHAGKDNMLDGREATRWGAGQGAPGWGV